MVGVGGVGIEDRLLERWVGRHPHGHTAMMQGPNIPTITDLRDVARRLSDRLALMTGLTWVAAGSLVGFEMLEVLLGSMLTAPEFVPVLILLLAIAAVLRDWWKRRTASGLGRRRWLSRRDLR